MSQAIAIQNEPLAGGRAVPVTVAKTANTTALVVAWIAIEASGRTGGTFSVRAEVRAERNVAATSESIPPKGTAKAHHAAAGLAAASAVTTTTTPASPSPRPAH